MKGFVGECGLRGGYFELLGFPNDVKQEIYKIASISLCSNTIGQIATGLMVAPPKVGDESYVSYTKEKNDILESLNRRSFLLSKALNNLEGISCNNIDGALYAFPTIKLPGYFLQFFY
jgi:alanine transaminase